MARTQVPESLTPAITISLKEFAETQRNYPLEMYKGEYFRVIQGVDEHYRALRDGWSEDTAAQVEYAPHSASPEAIAKAQAQQKAAIAKKLADEKAAMPANTVSMDQVQAMIASALEQQKKELYGVE